MYVDAIYHDHSHLQPKLLPLFLISPPFIIKTHKQLPMDKSPVTSEEQSGKGPGCKAFWIGTHSGI